MLNNLVCRWQRSFSYKLDGMNLCIYLHIEKKIVKTSYGFCFISLILREETWKIMGLGRAIWSKRKSKFCYAAQFKFQNGGGAARVEYSIGYFGHFSIQVSNSA